MESEGEPRKKRSHAVGGREYRLNRAALRDRCREENLLCALCGHPFSWDVEQYDPWSFTVHHIIDRIDGGDRDDINNMVPAHLICNQRDYGAKSKRRAAIQRGIEPSYTMDNVPGDSEGVTTYIHAVSKRWVI